jgi:hypothetical protein
MNLGIFREGTTNLRIRFSGTGYSFEGIDSSNPIPIGYTSSIKINAIGRNVELLVNVTFVSSVELPGTRTIILHISAPWKLPALALISNVNMVEITNGKQENFPAISISNHFIPWIGL